MVFYGYLSHPTESPAELHPEHTFDFCVPVGECVCTCVWTEIEVGMPFNLYFHQVFSHRTILLTYLTLLFECLATLEFLDLSRLLAGERPFPLNILSAPP